MSSLFAGLSFSELAGLFTCVSILGGALAWLVRQHHMQVFLTKRAYYAQRDDDAAAAKEYAVAAKETAEVAAAHRTKVIEEIEGLKKAVAALDHDHKLSKPAVENLSKTVDAVHEKLDLFFTELSAWRTQTEAKLAVVLDRQSRKRGGGQ